MMTSCSAALPVPPRFSLTKTPMPEQSVEQRLTNFDEVELGYTPEQAMQEAERCLNCPDRYCAAHCPAHNYIPEFIAEIRAGRFDRAWELLACTNPMMEISGRVCPYECQCESHCTRGIKGEPVAIGKLERFVADWHRANAALERDITPDDLVHDNDVVFLASGAERPVELNLPGRKLAQVVQARDYLTHPETYSGKRVLVIGGGNTAIDAARTAVRENADSVTLVYRRSEDAMPATQQERSIAKAEGVQLKTLRSPARFVGENGTLTGLECNIMQLTAPDYPGGRPNSAPTGETETLEADLVVLALGFENLPVAGVNTDSHNHIIIGKDFSTSVDKVYAGGDAVTGAATFMKAVAAGKDAAAAIFARLCE